MPLPQDLPHPSTTQGSYLLIGSSPSRATFAVDHVATDQQRMSELIDRLRGIQGKVTKLIKERDELMQRVTKLIAEQRDQGSMTATLNTRIAALERENEVLRTASSFKGEEQGRPEAKQRIDELVKEIDGCLALLKN